LTAPGIVTVRAIQHGNATYDAAFRDRSFSVVKGNARPTIAALPEVAVAEGGLLQVQIVANDSDRVLQVVPGVLLREVWTNLSNRGYLTDLRDPASNPDWPDQPHLVDTIATFETAPNAMDQYGVRLTGLLTAPETGDYRFFMSSDDEGALYLSPDDQPANRALIASEPQWNGSREWQMGANQASRGFPPSNVSSPIHLESGKKYYVEALMKEGGQGDNLAVTWQLPSQTIAPDNGSDPIGSNYLSALVQVAQPLSFTLVDPLPGVMINPLTGLLTWSPTEDQGPSTNEIVVVVSDDGVPSLTATQSFSVVVLESNSPPTLFAITDRTIHAGSMLLITNTAVDSDLPANLLNFSLESVPPSGADLDPATGVFSWQPDAELSNITNYFTVRVADDGFPVLAASQTFSVTVIPRPGIQVGSVSNNVLTLSWSAIPGQRYRLQSKSRLEDVDWTSEPGFIEAEALTAMAAIPIGTQAQGFFRVVLVP
jgi:hypothetical protein